MSWRDDLRRVDINQPGEWPAFFVIFIAIAACALLAYGGWLLVLKDQNSLIKSAKQQETQLRADFSKKKGMAINLPAYRAQMIEIEERLAGLVAQLPDSTEVPSLLIDITEAGDARGLEFVVFDPQPQRLEAFYAVLPILVQVKGSYFQLASFVSDLAQMSRIVTVADMDVAGADDGMLTASLMLQTYSYVPEQQ